MKKIVFALILSLAPASLLHAAEFVQITQDEVDIRLSPSDTAEVLGQADKGMIFWKQKSRTEGWYSIWLSYGTASSRYIHLSTAVEVDEPTEDKINKETVGITDACKEWFVAERRAKEESIAQETDLKKQHKLYSLLYEKYNFEIKKSYDISTAKPNEFNMWCVINVPLR